MLSCSENGEISVGQKIREDYPKRIIKENPEREYGIQRGREKERDMVSTMNTICKGKKHQGQIEGNLSLVIENSTGRNHQDKIQTTLKAVEKNSNAVHLTLKRLIIIKELNF